MFVTFVSKSSPMKNAILIVVSTIALLSCQNQEKKTQPKVENITVSVYASLTIEPEGAYMLYPESSGVLDTIFFDEGDTIRGFDIIAKIKSTVSNINVSSARLNVDVAKSKLQGEYNTLDILKNEIQTLQKQKTLDSTLYEKKHRLYQKGVGTQVELDNAKLKYEMSKNQLESRQQQYELTKVELINNYKLSKNNLRQSKTNLDNFFVRTKSGGTVYAIYKNEGEIIMPQEPLAKIGSSDNFIIELQIDEVDISKVNKDLKVLIKMDAYENEVYEAKITKIYPQKNVKTQTFTVEAKFLNAPKQLYAGMSGEANIIIKQKEKALTIPIEYLSSDNTIITEDGEVEVETGLKSLDKVEILSGIDENTTLIKPE